MARGDAMKTKPEKQLSIGFILLNRFTLTAFASFVDVLRLAADTGDQSRQIRAKWCVVSRDMQPIRASCGAVLQPDERLGDVTRFDYVVVVGGLLEHTEFLHPDYKHFLAKAAASNVTLVGLCTGGFALHDVGLMEGYRCCVSWFHRIDYLERFEGLEPISDQIFVVDRDRMTCSGGSSAAHLAAHIVEQHIGRRFAQKSLRILIVDEAFEASKAQPSLPYAMKTKDNTLRRAIAIMEQELDNRFRVDDLAERLRLSRRSLEERFRKGLGLSPARCMTKLRLEKAKQLLGESDMDVASIAMATGFCDSSHLNKAFLRDIGMRPGEFRERGASG